ncbi:glucosaminidase domain-containing protein [Candidatus Woesearchaeota archaeon]|nr:glucosaminidase domain-containing protein [Candidatus Woesearchaeota archaeon]MBW3022147.1 glucosaminidase domain-containing protein [Candidatus Woesearchaeota archaeon]
MVDIGEIGGLLNRGFNPFSQSHRNIGTTGPIVATLISLAWFYWGPQQTLFQIFVPMFIFLMLGGGGGKWVVFLAAFQFFISAGLAQAASLPASNMIFRFVGLFVVLPLWVIFGILLFLSRVTAAENQGIELPPLAMFLYWALIITLIAIFIGYSWTQFTTTIPSEKLVQARETAVKMWNWITTNFNKSIDIVRYGLYCWFQQMGFISGWNYKDIDECIREQISPSENETITGGTDTSIQDIVKAELKEPPYTVAEFGTQESIEVGAVLDVINPKKEGIDIEVTCEIKDARQTVQPSKIRGTGALFDQEGKVVKYKDVKRLNADLVCTPEQKTLPKGAYTVSFKATFKNVEAKAKLLNLFMAQDALRNLITDYAKQRKITITSTSEASVMRSLFPGLIQTYYAAGKVESKAEESFIRPMLETENVPIIGFYPEKSIRLKIGASNQQKGTPGMATIKFTLPQDMKIIPAACEEYKETDQLNVYEHKTRVNLAKLKQGGLPIAVGGCFIDVSRLDTLNPNVPEPRTIEVDITYDYTLNKDIPIRVKTYGFEGLLPVEGPAGVNNRINVAPTATKELIEKYVRENAHTPYKETGALFYDEGVRQVIDPVFAVAVAWHETHLGSANDIGKKCNNMFNIKFVAGRPLQKAEACSAVDSEGKGGYAEYATIEDGIKRFYQLIRTDYLSKGQDSIAKLVAPSTGTTCQTSEGKSKYYCCSVNSHCYCCGNVEGYNNWLRVADTMNKIKATT